MPRRIQRLFARCGLVVICAAAPAGCKRPHEFNFLSEPAYGATGNCPASPATGAGGPGSPGEGFSPDAGRCSYEDGLGGYVVELGGQVRADLGPGNPGVGAEGISVTLHTLTSGGSLASSTGPQIARAISDPQGNWHMSALVKKPGDHVVVARDGEEGPALAFIRVRIEQPDQPGLDGLVLVLPRDESIPPAP